MGRVQNMNIKGSMKEIDSNPHGRLWRVQDFSEGSNWRCGGNSRRTRITSKACRCDWTATTYGRKAAVQNIIHKEKTEKRGSLSFATSINY